MIRPHRKWFKKLLAVGVAFLLAFNMFQPTLVEAKRPPSPTPRPPPTGTAAPDELPAPELLSIANAATVSTGEITFAWSAVPGAACYQLQAGVDQFLDQQFNPIDRGCITATSYTFNASPRFVIYFPQLYWRVRARTTADINAIYGPWSVVWYFRFSKP